MRKRLLWVAFSSGAASLLSEISWQRYGAALFGNEPGSHAVVVGVLLFGLGVGHWCFGATRLRERVLVGILGLETFLAGWALGFPSLFWFAMGAPSPLGALLGIVSLFAPAFVLGGSLPWIAEVLSVRSGDPGRAQKSVYAAGLFGGALGSIAGAVLILSSVGMRNTLLLAGTFHAFNALVLLPLALKAPRLGPVALPRVSLWTEEGWFTLRLAMLAGILAIGIELWMLRIAGLSIGSSVAVFPLVVGVFLVANGVGAMMPKQSTPLTLTPTLGLLALSGFSLYASADHLPYWAYLLRTKFGGSDLDLVAYLGTVAIGGLVLFGPAAFLLGHFTPLLGVRWMRDLSPEQASRYTGALYGANAFGCLLGAVLFGWALPHFADLDGILQIWLGAALAVFAISLWHTVETHRWRIQVVGWGALLAILIPLLVQLPPFERSAFMQPFRKQSWNPILVSSWSNFVAALRGNGEYVFYRDAPSGTLAISATHIVSDGKAEERSRTVYVNGKSDGNTEGDFTTMSLSGLLPMLLSDRRARVGVIGFGTGITVQAILGQAGVEQVDLIEISSSLRRAAFYFDSYNGNVTRDPRLHWHVRDGFTHFQKEEKIYDVVISEPTNPWMTGVENLFTDEFYARVRARLHPDGMFAQWVQTYSFSPRLLRNILHTVRAHFPEVEVYRMQGSDLLVLARTKPHSVSEHEIESRLQASVLPRKWFLRTGITSARQVFERRVLDAEASRAFSDTGVPLFLEESTLGAEAYRSFFRGDSFRPEDLKTWAPRAANGTTTVF